MDLSKITGLMTADEVEAERAKHRFNGGNQKPQPRVLEKADKKKSKLKLAADFRAAVWDRDKHKSRASGKPLTRAGVDFDRVGEIHHVIPRSLAPERVYDVANGLLLSKHEHALAEACCSGDPSKRLLDIVGPDDRGELQTFIWRDKDGTELRRRQS